MHNSYLLCSVPLPHSHYRTPYLVPQLSYFIMRHLRFFFCFCSVLVSGWESLRRSLLEAGASRRLMEIGNEAAQFLFLGTYNLYLLCSAPLPHSHDRTPYLSMPQLSYFIMRHLRFFFVSSSVLVSGWESLRRSLLEAGASRRLMEDIRLAAAALRQNILAVGGPDTPLLDTLDQGDLTTRLHKFRVSQTAFRYFFKSL
jgi:hypothetical protein